MCLTLLQLSLIFNRCCGGSLSIINIKQNRIQFWFHVLESPHLSEDVSCFSSILFLLFIASVFLELPFICFVSIS